MSSKEFIHAASRNLPNIIKGFKGKQKDISDEQLEAWADTVQIISCSTPLEKAVAHNLSAQVDGIMEGIRHRPISAETAESALEFWRAGLEMLSKVAEAPDCPEKTPSKT